MSRVRLTGLSWLLYVTLAGLVLVPFLYLIGRLAPWPSATTGVSAYSTSTAVSPAPIGSGHIENVPDRSVPPNELANNGVSVAALAQRNSNTDAIGLTSKQIVGSGDVRQRQWTPTPVPSPTPLPSPTPVPTFVSDPSQSNLLSPLGLAPSGKWIDVSLDRQHLVAYEGRTPVFQTKVSTGTASHPTVTGQFRIWLRFTSQDMDGRRLGYDYYLPDVPYVQYFYQDYALHGTYWHNNFGHPMSHGCVNLPTPAAEWLFSWADYGTLVNVHP